MDVIEKRYPYKPRLFSSIFVVLFFGVFAGFMGYFSYQNDSGLVLNGIVEMSPTGATVFYWLITVLFVAFSALGVLLAIKSVQSKAELVLTDEYVRAPKSGISKKIITVPFNDVEKVSVQAVKGTVFLNIFHRKGKFTIVSSVLPNMADFDEVKKHIMDRVRC